MIQFLKIKYVITLPILPDFIIDPGMIPILHSFGFIIPGQFGPIIRVTFYYLKICLTFIISHYGIPSVITTTNSSSASIASIIAAAANGGGTYITDALHPVYYLAS